MKKIRNAYNILVGNYNSEKVIWEVKSGREQNIETEVADWFTVGANGRTA
jgi:hypothetical protein